MQSQSVLSRSDNDRRQLEERLASLQASITELKRQKEQASESRQKAQQDLANAEIRNAELEMNLKALRGVSSVLEQTTLSVGPVCTECSVIIQCI